MSRVPTFHKVHMFLRVPTFHKVPTFHRVPTFHKVHTFLRILRLREDGKGLESLLWG